MSNTRRELSFRFTALVTSCRRSWGALYDTESYTKGAPGGFRCNLTAWRLVPDFEEKEALTPLLKPYPAEVMEAYPVSRRVNSPSNNEPGCIEAVA